MRPTPANTIDVTWIILGAILMFGVLHAVKTFVPDLSAFLPNDMIIYLSAPIVMGVVLVIRRKMIASKLDKGDANVD